MFKALRETLNSKPTLVPVSEQFNIDKNKDWYTSLFFYNDAHRQQFNTTGTLSGIKNTVTNRLYFDFDSKEDLNLARQDALSLATTLIETYNLSEDNIKCFFTGSKGFAIEIELKNKLITPDEFKAATFTLASQYETFDRVVNDPNRIVRIENTKHQTTGLYKIPIYLYELAESDIERILTLAKLPRQHKEVYKPVTFPNTLFTTQIKEKALIDKSFDVNELDFSHKIKGWTNCKWAISQGYQVKQNDRHDKLLCLISQSKALNYTKEQAYYTAKLADEYGVNIYGGTKSSKEDIWAIAESVYSDSWKGGTYSCKDGKSPWLTDICNSLGPNKCKHNETENLVDVDKVFSEFFTYAKDIEKNTIKTGIPDLDERLRIVIGQMVGLLGAPSSGKTAMALEILENTSKAGLLSVFYSLDMASSELFQKIAQRVTGYNDVKLFNIFKQDPIQSAEIGKKVADAYANVKFCFDTGVSVDKIETTIDDFESSANKKVKLLLLDYNELLSSPYSDMTASSGYNAGAIKKLTNNRGLCTISLLQPPKVIGDASDEITSYRNIKGSSLLEQCFSTIIGIYRPGFSAENDSQDDNFMVMNLLKNRLGKLFSLQFYWDGSRGKISTIDSFGRDAIKELKDKKKAQSSDKGGLNF